MADPTLAARALPAQPAAERKKHCSCCAALKPISAFHRAKDKPRGVRDLCKLCVCAQQADRYRTNEAMQAASAANARRANYGLSRSDFDALVCGQAGRCKICEEPLGPGARQMHVDHCHTTGRVRGLLCHGCNKTLGFAKDSPALLRAMADYIEGYK